MALTYYSTTYQEDFPSRLDRWLRRRYPSLTQGVVQKALRDRFIRVNHAKSQASTSLQQGDVVSVEIHLHERWIALSSSERSTPPTPDFSSLILDETNDLLIINKPSGLDVQGGTKVQVHLDAWLKRTYPDARLVHRIDKATSGLLCVAKNLRMAMLLTDLFRNRQVHKTYRAIVWGRLHPQKGRISEPIHDVDGRIPARPAQTEYRVIRKGSFWSDVELTPLTGRKHQLRIHMAGKGNPILGDKKYDIEGKTLGLLPPKGVLFLHAHRLSFCDADGKVNSWVAPLPSHWPFSLHTGAP